MFTYEMYYFLRTLPKMPSKHHHTWINLHFLFCLHSVYFILFFYIHFFISGLRSIHWLPGTYHTKGTCLEQHLLFYLVFVHLFVFVFSMLEIEFKASHKPGKHTGHNLYLPMLVVSQSLTSLLRLASLLCSPGGLECTPVLPQPLSCWVTGTGHKSIWSFVSRLLNLTRLLSDTFPTASLLISQGWPVSAFALIHCSVRTSHSDSFIVRRPT